MSGLFITFEGPEGSGKTTIANMVLDTLKQEGYPILYTREPGGIDIAEQIREVILKKENTAMDPKTEALLYAASRRQHLVQRVLPALAEGKVVVCERFIDSSLAYQGYGRQIGFDEVLSINKFAIGDTFPDITIYLDVNEEVGLSRIKNRKFKDRLDVESIEFHHRVNEGYAKVVETFKDRIRVVDASKPLEEVVKTSYAIVKGMLND